MPDMLELLRSVYDRNEAFGGGQVAVQGRPPEYVSMIDGRHKKPISAQMRQLYGYAIEWKKGLLGFDAIDPNRLDELYGNPAIKTAIDMVAKYYKPIPPSDSSDWKRTALLAVEDEGQGAGLCLYWWRSDDVLEPCIISIDGGDIKIFADLNEYVDYLANGTFPEQGDTIYTELEEERGTLSD